jgi:hypothetical protein
MSLKKFVVKRLNEYSFKSKEARFVAAMQRINNDEVLKVDIEGDEVNFAHTGHLGDIIYSLPAVYKLAEGRKINYYFHLNRTFQYPNRMSHPNGNILMTEKNVELIQPLLLHQPEINKCEAYSGQPIHYELDIFRKYPFDYRMGSIARWYFIIYGINSDLGKSWLTVTPDTSVSDAIIVARSSRYHTPGISYSFLKKYPRVVFVGLPAEYEEMKSAIPNLEYKPVKNYFELAAVIAGGKFFIGNQSSPFAVAEGLKVKRVLEMYYQVPNVMVEGANGYDFCMQPQFEKIVANLYEQKF